MSHTNNIDPMSLCTKISLLASLLLSSMTATAGSENSRLIGKWIMQSSSMQFPDSCKSMTFQFLADGTYIGNDGSMVLTMKYEMAEVENGLILTFSPPVSDNGHANCQGLSPQFVRQHPLRKSLMRFVENEETLRMYFGPTAQSPYAVLRRQD
jgi:hypothetical protein